MRGSPAHTFRGFTLLEVLLAMTLLSVIVTIGFAVMRVSFNSWEAGETRFQYSERQAMTIGFLRNVLGNALPLTDELTGKQPVFSFIGTAGGIRFIADPPQPVSQGLRYRFLLAGDAQQGRLQLTYEPYARRLLSVVPQPDRITVMRGVKGVSFAYYGRRPEKRQPEWLPAWSFPYLPLLVRVAVRSEGGAWEFTVPLRLGAS